MSLPNEEWGRLMKTWSRARGLTAVLILFCAAAGIVLVGLGHSRWVPLLAVPLVLGSLLYKEVLRLAPGSGGRGAAPSAEADGEDKRLYLQTLNHQRHDFMNDIQVLYGYIRLKKYDKLLEFVETMKSKTARESSISRLGPAELSLYLHSFCVRHRSVELEVELDQEIHLNELPVDAEGTGALAIATMEALVAGLQPSDEEPDRLAMEIYTEDDALYLCFEFYGQSDAERLERAVETAVHPFRERLSAQADSRIDDRWATVELRVPFREQAASA